MDDDQENIDDLIDYKFEKNDYDSNYDQDSFGEDINKYYEDHKKLTNNKTTEVQNQNRPISSYQRVSLSGKNKEDNNCNNNEVNIPELIQRFNNFIQLNKISKTQFSDLQSLYIDESEFRDLFRKIKFEISSNEILALFSNKNPNYEEGYILIRIFFDNYPELEWKSEIPILNSVSTDNTDYKKINNEFKMLNDEIYQIIQKESMKPNNSSKRIVKSAVLKPIKPTNSSSVINGNIKNTYDNNRPITSIIPIQADREKSQKNKNVMQKFFIESNNKKIHEDRALQSQLEKRILENEAEFRRKIKEANEIINELGIFREYKAMGESERNNKFEPFFCREMSDPEKRIYYKEFCFELRKLKREAHKIKKEHSGKETYNKYEASKILSPEKGGRMKRQERIKEFLIKSIKLKMKLKKQIESLKEKTVIDENLILEELKKKLDLN